MKKQINRKYVAKGLAVALVLGGVFTVPSITPSYKSDNLGIFSAFFDKSAYSLIAEAEEVGNIELDESYLSINADTINGFSSEGKKKFDKLIAENGYKVVNVSFADTITPKTIAQAAFQNYNPGDTGNSFDNEGVTFNLTLPDSIETIESFAFRGHKHISSIIFSPNTKIQTIEKEAFKNAGLKGELTLPEGIRELGNGCFRNNEISKVNIPDSLTTVHGYLFAENKIDTINWGNYNVIGSIAGTDIENQSIIPGGMFYNNNLKHIDIPDKVIAVDYEAFSTNLLEELTIKKNIRFLGNGAFQHNYIPGDEDSNIDDHMPAVVKRTIKKLTFEEGGALQEIGPNVFRASIDGNIDIPDYITSIGENAFRYNNITKLRIPSSKPALGNNAFLRTPLESIENLNSTHLGDSVFNDLLSPLDDHEYKTLKNVSFDYEHLDDNFTTLPARFFVNNLLKSMNFPAQITSIEDDAFGLEFDTPEGKHSYHNPGWYNDNNKVALYRVGTDGKTYVTNGDLADGDYYVVNPVLFKFDLKDQYGNPLPAASLPQNIKAEITRNGVTTTYTDISVIDSTHFKLGDKVKFTLPATPTGYDFIGVAEQTGLTKISDTEYEVSLDPATIANAVKDVSYEAGYKVGYKTAVIELKYNNPFISPVIPSDPGTPAVPSTPTAPTPATPEQPQNKIAETDTPQGNTDTANINDDSTPQGNTDDDVDIDDDSTPQGNSKSTNDKINVDDIKSPLGTLPQTGGNTGNLLVLLGAALISMGIVIKKKFM